MRILASALSKNRFISGVSKLVGASVLGQLFGLLAMPLLTRLYQPEDFGAFGVFASLMAVLLVISSFRYELAIPLPKSENSAMGLLFLSLILNILSAVVVTFLVLLYGENVNSFNNNPVVGDLLWLLPVSVLAGGTYKSLNYWVLRKKEYGTISSTKLVQSVSNILAQVITGFLGVGAVGLAVGQIIGQSSGTVRFLRGISFARVAALGMSKRSLVLLWRYRNFPIYDSPAAFVNTISTQLPNVALAVIFSPVVAGYYYLAERILWVPLSMIAQALGQVFFSQLREEIESGSVVTLVIKIMLVLSVVGAAVSIPVYFFSELVFSIVFGREWEEAGKYAGILIFGLVMQFVYSPLSMIFLATNNQKTNFIIHFIILLCKVGSFYLAYVWDDPVLAIQLLMITLFVGYGFALILVFRCARDSIVSFKTD